MAGTSLKFGFHTGCLISNKYGMCIMLKLPSFSPLPLSFLRLRLFSASSMCSLVGWTPRIVLGLFPLTISGVLLTFTVVIAHTLQNKWHMCICQQPHCSMYLRLCYDTA